MLEYINNAIGIIGGISTVIGFILGIREPDKRYFHALYMLLIAAGVSAATYEYSINRRIESIEREADGLVDHFDHDYTSRGFVFAALAFLEKNKNLFPDAYNRASDACNKINCTDSNSDTGMVELSYTLKGLVRGLGSLASK